MSEDMYRSHPEDRDPLLPMQHYQPRWRSQAQRKVERRARRLWVLVRRGVLGEKAYEESLAEIRQRYGIDWRLTPRIIEPGPIYPVQVVPVWQHLVPRTPAQGTALYQFKPITGKLEEQSDG